MSKVVSLVGSSVSMVLVDMVVIPGMLEGYAALFTIIGGRNWLEITLKSHGSHVHSHLLPYQVNINRTKIILTVFALVLPATYKVGSYWLGSLNSSPAGQLHACFFWQFVFRLGCVCIDGGDWPALTWSAVLEVNGLKSKILLGLSVSKALPPAFVANGCFWSILSFFFAAFSKNSTISLIFPFSFSLTLQI